MKKPSEYVLLLSAVLIMLSSLEVWSIVFFGINFPSFPEMSDWFIRPVFASVLSFELLVISIILEKNGK